MPLPISVTRAAALSTLLLASSCATSVVNTPDAAGLPTADAADDTPIATADRSVALDGEASILDVGVDAGPPAVSVCAGVACRAGEACCLLNGRCFDPVTDRGACAMPPMTDRERACASNLDCVPGEFCAPDRGSACVGPGHCVSRENCGSCSGSACAACGCDGQTYSNPQSACRAGVRVVIVPGACGSTGGGGTDAGEGPRRIPCSHSSHCPSGEQCCPNTGVCFDPACPGCCRTPPEGSDFPCTSNEQCYPFQYCRGVGCGTPGGCVTRRGTGECPGTVQQVCGCDGRTYINDCWASGAGVRVSALGPCPIP